MVKVGLLFVGSMMRCRSVDGVPSRASARSQRALPVIMSLLVVVSSGWMGR